MSNYEFLMQDKNMVIKYPFLETLYSEAISTENMYYVNVNIMLFKCRQILEYAVDNYRNIKKLKITKNYKSQNNNQSNSIIIDKNENLRDKLFTVDLPGHALSNATSIRRIGNYSTHDLTYIGNGDGDDLECLSKLHDFILWMYNDITNSNIKNEFDISRIDKQDILEIKCYENINQYVKNDKDDIATKPKKKKSIKLKPPGYSFSFKDNKIIVIDANKNVVFEMDKKEETQINNRNLLDRIEKISEELRDIKSDSLNAQKQLLDYQSKNINAVKKLQEYCDRVNIENTNRTLLIEEIDIIRKEENEFLNKRITEIEEAINDKFRSVDLLYSALNENTTKLFYLENKVTELEIYILMLKDSISISVNNEKYLLYSKVDKINDGFENRKFESADDERTFTINQVKNFFYEFKQRYNTLYLNYQGEKIVSEKTARKLEVVNFEREKLENEINLKCQQLNFIEKKQAKQNKRNLLNRRILLVGLSIISIICLIMGFLIWNSSNKISSGGQIKTENAILRNKNSEYETIITEKDKEITKLQDTIKDQMDNTDIKQQVNSSISEEDTVATPNRPYDADDNSTDTKVDTVGVDKKISELYKNKEHLESLPKSIGEIPNISKELLDFINSNKLKKLYQNNFEDCKLLGESYYKGHYQILGNREVYTLDKYDWIKFLSYAYNPTIELAVEPDVLCSDLSYESTYDDIIYLLGEKTKMYIGTEKSDFAVRECEEGYYSISYYYPIEYGEVSLAFIFDKNANKLSEYVYVDIR